jgi:hypothetical protein
MKSIWNNIFMSQQSKKKIIDVLVDNINYNLVFTQYIYTDKYGNKKELYYDKNDKIYDIDYNLVGIYTPDRMYLFEETFDYAYFNKKL